MRGHTADLPLEPWEHDLQGLLFLLITVCSFHLQWSFNGHDPYEFLRHGNDSLGYYQWLPAAFVDHAFGKMYWCHQMENGQWISLFTIGCSILWLPFFLIGHWAAWSFGYPMDGFSAPYGVAFMAGSALFAGTACVLAFRLARRYSTTIPALTAVLLLFACTNLFHYAVVQTNFSHLPSFLLISLYAWSTLKLLDGNGGRWAFLFLASGALLVLVRQLNVFSLLLPLLLAEDRVALHRMFSTLVTRRGPLVAGLLVAILPWLLQLAYWYSVTGEVLVFTYGKKGEHFEFDKMVPGMVLFSVRNGWLVYSPLFLPVLLVLARNAWQGMRPARTVLFLLTMTLLFYSAWWCWFLGSSFGHRGFVDIYGLLTIPLAWTVALVQRQRVPIRLAGALIAAVLIHLNLGLTGNYEWWWSGTDWTWQDLFQEISALFMLTA